ncbi:hypothetical protein KNT81_gp068 [Proteus phage phiP4-3]|uniref:Uncharacterized protein n=1 Tax=Proteus phage phiP4-3 TaxID=2065203 RepID=A0A2I6PFC9_9CAUD|nr:hypothetical protein KNT81_gp068 [Proteus phage phiP4-3]AUM58426.1 hypothetical protein phiP43_068 [Proteus phage phiP4-3]
MKLSSAELLKMLKDTSRLDGDPYGPFEYSSHITIIEDKVLSVSGVTEIHSMVISSEEDETPMEFTVSINTSALIARII